LTLRLLIRRILPFLLTLLALAAQAVPFDAQDVLSGRGLDLPGQGPHWQAGVDVHVSAARAVLRRIVQKQVDAYVQQYPQASGYQAYAADPRVQKVRDLVTQGDLPALKTALKSALGQQGTLKAKDVAAIDAISRDDVHMLDAWFQVQDAQASALLVTTEPYLAWSAEHVRLAARLPVALQNVAGSSTMRAGNLGLDAQFGSAMTEQGPTSGATLGLTLWLPTASEGTPLFLRSDRLATPGLGGRFVGVQPHATMGIDLGWLEWIVRGDLALLAPVGGGAAATRYATLGSALVLDLGRMALAAEVDRLVDLGGAADLDRVWLAGVRARVKLGPVRVGLGAQMPFAPGDDVAFGGLGGTWAQRLADLRIGMHIGGVW
jgi:hypothetical protein